MSKPHRGTVAATLAAALLTALAALVAIPTTASAQGTLDPLFGAPSVGDCKNYTWADGAGRVETSEPVDCATGHTARVIAVPLLPDSLTWDSSDAAIGRAVTRRCFPAMYEALGRTDKLRSLSAYSIHWFEPTNAQKANGARWFRCDITLWGGERLELLPTDASPMLPPAPLPDSVARCLKRDGLMTVCSRGHSWRATGAKTVDQDAYPGRKKLLRIANDKCPGLTTSSAWYATWPRRLVWSLGAHTIVCYSKTSS